MTIDNVILGADVDPDWGNAVADAINPTAWTAVTFQNSWVNYGSGEQNVEYRKINDIVYLRGVMKSGTMSVEAFTLPTGFRPPKNCFFAVPSNNGYGQLYIAPSGGAALTVGSNVSCHLDVVSFSIT